MPTRTGWSTATCAGGSAGSRPPAACGRPRPRSTPPSWPRAHARYAAERDAALARDHAGPRPSGGVGGTRSGVKCLHAHYAWYLAGGDDPVGRWVADHLESERPPTRARGDRERTPATAPRRPPSTAAPTRPASSSPTPRRRRGGGGRTGPDGRHRPSSGSCASPASARASTPPAGSRPRRSSAPSTCCASTARSWTGSASSRPADHRHVGRPRRRQPRGVLRRRRGGRRRRPELLTGEEEGRLSFRGATPSSTRTTAPSSSSTSAAARPSSPSAPPSPKGSCRSTSAACA